MFNWMSLIQLIPALIVGVQQIHANANGATKKQKVLEYIGLGEGAAEALQPGFKPLIDSVNQTIDSIVSLFHATNAPGFGANSAPSTTPLTTAR